MFLLSEVIDIILTIIIAGYVLRPLTKGDLKESFIIAGLSIVLHELGHKFIAINFGFKAVYHANLSGLGFGLILSLLNVPVFFVPAFVSISGDGSSIGYLFTALAGPLTNLLIFLISRTLLSKFNYIKWVQDNNEFINSLMIINLWLGLFNLIPIPGTDGFNALYSLRFL